MCHGGGIGAGLILRDSVMVFCEVRDPIEIGLVCVRVIEVHGDGLKNAVMMVRNKKTAFYQL